MMSKNMNYQIRKVYRHYFNGSRMRLLEIVGGFYDVRIDKVPHLILLGP